MHVLSGMLHSVQLTVAVGVVVGVEVVVEGVGVVVGAGEWLQRQWMNGREHPSHSGEVLLVRMHSGHWWKGGPLPVGSPQSQQRRGPLAAA